MVATMTSSRYALRSAAFVAVYLGVFLAAAWSPWFHLPAGAVAAAWLTAQAGYGRRRLDVIMLATTAMVGATLEGAGLLLCAAVAVSAVLPAVLFAVLLERWLPGYWQGHGDRFRSRRVALGRLAATAVLTATTGVILQDVIDTSFDLPTAAFLLVRDTAILMLLPLVIRAVRRPGPPPPAGTPRDRNRRPTLTVVR